MRVGAALAGIALSLSAGAFAAGQHGGLRAGGSVPVESPVAGLSIDEVHSHLSVEGSCQKRVRPTSVRLIWAVTAEAADAATCRVQVEQKIRAAVSAWSLLGIGQEQIVEDFIAAVPRYEWTEDPAQAGNALVERQTGYLVQSNLHVQVPNNEVVVKAISAALAAGLTDLIGVDYAADLEAARKAAREGAIAVAKEKSDQLLSLVFESKPRPINVQEVTRVLYPEHLYRSFEHVASGNLTVRYDDGRARIAAYRPQNTYYAGLVADADNKSWDLPMEPEIVIESRVVIYFQSPSTRDWSRGEDDRK